MESTNDHIGLATYQIFPGLAEAPQSTPSTYGAVPP